MAEPLKNMFSPKFLEQIAAEMREVAPAFPVASFLTLVFDESWAQLELKQRIRHISRAFRAALQGSEQEAIEQMRLYTEHYLAARGEGMRFDYSFMPDFVELYGLEFPDISIPALETITRLSSAEFAVRPFLNRYPKRMFAQMLQWSKHSSAAVRRLSSEGIRPRLPWGLGVPALKKDPSPILPILENLKNDPAETVRRSVANNLNDIAKDHPELVIDLIGRWQGSSKATDWIIKHASRSLLKKGHEKALATFGFDQNLEQIEVSNLKAPSSLSIGDTLHFSFDISNQSPDDTLLRLEYSIDYITSTGKISTKVFNIKEFTLKSGQTMPIQRRQSFTDFTVRKHYPGNHCLRILVNGNKKNETVFNVLMC